MKKDEIDMKDVLRERINNVNSFCCKYDTDALQAIAIAALAIIKIEELEKENEEEW